MKDTTCGMNGIYQKPERWLNNTIGIGAPFLYLLDMYSINTKLNQKSNLFLCILASTIIFIEIENVYSKYIKEINEIKSILELLQFHYITLNLERITVDHLLNKISQLFVWVKETNPKFLKNFTKS